jgi:hypothetical protein
MIHLELTKTKSGKICHRNGWFSSCSRSPLGTMIFVPDRLSEDAVPRQPLLEE